MIYSDGPVEYFAVQEPEGETRPMFYMWMCMNAKERGSTLVLIVINFNQGENYVEGVDTWKFDDPQFRPLLKVGFNGLTIIGRR